MSSQILDTEGCPRDQGLDQGREARGAIRDRVARAGIAQTRRTILSLRPFLRGPNLGAGPGREIVRHYTHLAERAEGIALAAGLPLSALIDIWLNHPGSLATAATSAAGDGRLVRVLPPNPSPGSRWVLRRSRPEVGFASIEVTLPWLASSVAGVNDAGLAAALATLPDGNAAMPSLLVQEALQRFSDIDGALDWCLKRPVQGRAGIVLTDARGELAGIEIDGRERRVVRANDGVLAMGGGRESLDALRKGLEEGAPVDPSRLAGEGAAIVAIHPDRCELSLAGVRVRASE